MSKCPQCGYHGQDYKFKESAKLWEIDIETGVRTGDSWQLNMFISISTAFAAGNHRGMEIVVAHAGEFDHQGKLTRYSTGDVVITSSDDWQRKGDIAKNVLEWFGTWTEIRDRWK